MQFNDCNKEHFATTVNDGKVEVTDWRRQLACPASLYPICVQSEARRTRGRLTGQSSRQQCLCLHISPGYEMLKWL